MVNVKRPMNWGTAEEAAQHAEALAEERRNMAAGNRVTSRPLASPLANIFESNSTTAENAEDLVPLG